MQRVLAVSAVMCGLVGAAAATPAGAADSTAALDHFTCRHSSDPRSREISVQAVMRAQPYPSRMALRFELLFTGAGQRAAASLRGGDLGRWRHPTNPASLGQRSDDVWKLTKTVTNLTADGTYRFRVTFRWTPSQGGQVQETTLMSSDCTQQHG